MRLKYRAGGGKHALLVVGSEAVHLCRQIPKCPPSCTLRCYCLMALRKMVATYSHISGASTSHSGTAARAQIPVGLAWHCGELGASVLQDRRYQE